ncbi:putative serpin-Z8 [Triticum dicoccoides]|uniref:putative serpin-Z8 n=1 Tax=Triticum dicoccoides TaxID=85692 RepID=UPI00188FF183|nr:putative serpin-Z8 [Triticum dicoccoides]
MELEVGPSESGGLAALAADLARRLAEENSESNLVFSPLSIYAAVALLAAGARGATLDEILGVLGAPSRAALEVFVSLVAEQALRDQSGSGGPRIAFACGVWSDLTCALKPAYRHAVLSTYKAEASTVDFQNDPEGARGQINEWAARATQNLIGGVLGPESVTPLTRVVLGNAIYFKGKWQEPFCKRDTESKLFHRLDGRAVDVPFMQSWEPQFIAIHSDFWLLRLRHLPEEKIDVREFRVPKFKLSFHGSVVDILKKLGLQLAFSDQADLSDMVEDDESGLPLVLNDVIHKAVIEVNEEGTIAAAVSIYEMLFGGVNFMRPPPPRVDFVADHPFAYLIVEETTGAVVFAGHVLDPSIES